MGEREMVEESANVAGEEPKAEDADLAMKDIKSFIADIEDSVKTKEPRIMYRALRSLVQMRPKLTPSFIGMAVETVFEECSRRDSLLTLFPPGESGASSMDVDDSNNTESSNSKTQGSIDTQVFVQLMAAL